MLPLPAVDVVLAGVVGGEGEPLVVVVPVEQVAEVPGPVADVDVRVGEVETRKRVPCVYSAMPFAVAGVSCIRPTAPAPEWAFALNLLSDSITAASRAASMW